jgi:hypothetical protein
LNTKQIKAYGIVDAGLGLGQAQKDVGFSKCKSRNRDVNRA